LVIKEGSDTTLFWAMICPSVENGREKNFGRRDRWSLCKESRENLSHYDVRDGKPRFT